MFEETFEQWLERNSYDISKLNSCQISWLWDVYYAEKQQEEEHKVK